MNGHEFCRDLLRVALQYASETGTVSHTDYRAFDVNETTIAQTNKQFSVACVPRGSYWYGRACCKWEARAKALQELSHAHADIIVGSGRGPVEVTVK